MKRFDVIIVGAGPAGSAAAIGLARLGYDVAMVDKRTFPREKLCGDFINPINWAILRDLGVEDRVLALPHGQVRGFRITNSSGREAASHFGSKERPGSVGLAVRRAAFDQLLVERAAELGVTLGLGCRIEKMTRTDRRWRLGFGEQIWQGRCLIGADGRNSWVARQLGVHRSQAMQGWAVGLQSRLPIGNNTDQIEIHTFPGGYAGIVELGDGTATLGMAVDKRVLGRGRRADFLVNQVLAQNPRLKERMRCTGGGAEIRAVYPVYFAKRRCIAEGALLVGDAARVSEPVTGEGVYFAMRSGLLAAESIDVALQRGNLTEAGLVDYERHCRTAFRSRSALNAFLRFAVYRPALVEPLIWLWQKNGRWLDSLVEAVCAP